MIVTIHEYVYSMFLASIWGPDKILWQGRLKGLPWGNKDTFGLCSSPHLPLSTQPSHGVPEETHRTLSSAAGGRSHSNHNIPTSASPLPCQTSLYTLAKKSKFFSTGTRVMVVAEANPCWLGCLFITIVISFVYCHGEHRCTMVAVLPLEGPDCMGDC